MKLIFESLNDTRVKGEVCTETAILNCINDIKNIVRESTEESKKEEKKGLGARTLDMLKAGYKKVLEFLTKMIDKINEFRKKVWAKIKGGAKSNSKDNEKAQSTGTPKSGQLAIGQKTYKVYDCLHAKTSVKNFIDKMIDKEVITSIQDATERNKKIDEAFYTSVYGGKGVTTHTALPEVEVSIDDIDKAIEAIQEQAHVLVGIVRAKERDLNNPRLTDELVKTVASETLTIASRVGINMGSVLAYLLSVIKK